MKVLLIGSGGREHAIAWKVSQSTLLTKLYCAPGNPGTSKLAKNVALKVDDISGLLKFALENKIDLTIVGPEYPLSLGIVDVFKKQGLKIFGPSQSAAMLESSKSFAKEIMQSAEVRTAASEVFEDLESAKNYIKQKGVPLVLKADGLASGKGVFVCMTVQEADEALQQLFLNMKINRLVIEDFLSGKEASYIVATDGERIVPLAASNDYKRIFDDDQGPNTGGMGTVSPTSNLAKELEANVLEEIIKPVLSKMKERGYPFCGFLYAGLMISEKSEINVIEFNVRLGDPETQVIMRRMEGDFLQTLNSLSTPEDREHPKLDWKKQTAICVVQAASGYPGKVSSGDEIIGIEQAEELEDVIVFHAGTLLDSYGKLVTAGGRVLNITALGNSKEVARNRVYKAADLINFRGKQYRKDIGK